MKRLIGPMNAAIVLSFFLLCALPGLAMENQYTEDFSTTLFKDAAHTTANWDTAAGELSLFPFHSTILGNYDTPGYAYAVTVSGDYAFVADYASGLKIIDISDPANPTLLGTYDTPGDALDVTVSGDYAFVADKVFGLQIIHISDPTHPILLGSYDTPDMAYGVTVSGDYAFVADYRTGLQVFDISDPVNPALLGTCDTPGGALDVMVSGDYAFVADYDFGLQVIDISDPTNPTIIGTCDTPGYAQSITVAGGCVFMTDYYSGLQVIDISSPTKPKLIGTCDTPDRASAVVVTGDYAYVADYGSGLQVVDILDPTNPTLLEGCDTPGRAIGVVVAGDRAFVADHASGLQVINISSPKNPISMGTCGTPGSAQGVTVSGDYAFVADYDSGLQVIDISDPINPTILGTCDTPGYARSITVAGDYAFVADDDSGLQVIDISDPTNPTLLGNYNTPGIAYGVTVSGDYAFVADFATGLQIIDISDPTNPTLLGTCDTPGDARDVTVSGDYAFVADTFFGLQIINISDPINPTILGTCDTPDAACAVTVSGDYAFVADYNPGLQIIDISDPTNPTIIGNYDPPGLAVDVAVSGDYAFLGGWDLFVVDISSPANPTLLGRCPQPGWAEGVAVSGDYVFSASFGLQTIMVFNSGLYSDKNVSRSLFIDGSDDTIIQARFTTTQIDSIQWEISADGGVSWQGILPGTGWERIDVPGADLLWRSTLQWEVPGDNPVVTELQIKWLVAPAVIENIVDIPDDQGGWVQAHFTRSGLDFSDEDTLPISNYGIWRRVDNTVLITALNSASSFPSEKNATADTPYLSGMPMVTYQGSTYVQSQSGLATSSFPPGTWEWVATVPAVQQDAYIAAVPTVADSCASGANQTVLIMTAHTTTPSIWYVCEPDSGYSVDNIAPAVPTSFAIDYNAVNGNQLSWDPCPDGDFQHFNIYRSNDPDFVPSPSDLAHSATGTSWTDPEYYGWNVYYKVSALDFVGNESDPASAETVTAVGGSVLPQTYGLHPNAPNPFNPITTIRYDVPAGGGTVTLRIYDVSGTLVRTLLDGPQTAGQKSVTWNGKDSRGRSVASGVYFYRLQAPGYEKTLKMILVQ